MQLSILCVNNRNYLVYCIVLFVSDSDMADYWSNIRFRQGVPVFNALFGGEPLNLGLRNFSSRNWKRSSVQSVVRMVHKVFPNLEPFRRDSRV